MTAAVCLECDFTSFYIEPEPNEAYFNYLRKVIEYANSKGLFIALVPMWGSYLVPNLSWGGKVKPVFTADSAATFTRYLAQKFGDLDLIWMLGGDRSYIAPEHKAIIKAMATSIREVVQDKQLITAHTQGGRSLWDMLEQPDYLDFITWQSGHMGKCYPSWRSIARDYARLSLIMRSDAPLIGRSFPVARVSPTAAMLCGKCTVRRMSKAIFLRVRPRLTRTTLFLSGTSPSTSLALSRSRC